MITVNELERKLKVLEEYIADQCKLSRMVSDGIPTFGNALVQNYIEALSIAAGDEELTGRDSWLYWYVWDNEFGKRKLTVTIDGKEIVVDRVGRLMKCIEFTREAEQ